jgi:hypothetical protein
MTCCCAATESAQDLAVLYSCASCTKRGRRERGEREMGGGRDGMGVGQGKEENYC